MRRIALLSTALAGLSLAAHKPIAITNELVSSVEDGPSAGTGYEFIQGEAVYVKFRLADYARAKDADDKESIRLGWKVEAFDSAGVPLVEPKSESVNLELAKQDKEWSPVVRHEFLLPILLDPGQYRIVITAYDLVHTSDARKELSFRVRGRAVEKSDTLVVRNFRFLRSEEDGTALSPAAYRPGESVWARFEMTGYKMGEKNSYDVAYGLEVFRADGKSMYSEPNAAHQQETSFYRHRYAPGVLNLNLQPDIAKGAYTVLLKVRDESGKQEFESRHTFTVE
ncbi:MAG: hypothetical protein U0Q16_19345 [Bryobacteraceae bacterium]